MAISSLVSCECGHSVFWRFLDVLKMPKSLISARECFTLADLIQHYKLEDCPTIGSQARDDLWLKVQESLVAQIGRDLPPRYVINKWKNMKKVQVRLFERFYHTWKLAKAASNFSAAFTGTFIFAGRKEGMGRREEGQQVWHGPRDHRGSQSKRSY